MPESKPDESTSEREARQEAERKRAVWIVLGSMIAGIVALIIAAVLLMPE